MQEYELLFLCYRSGQISESEWQDHLKNPDFSNWMRGHYEAQMRAGFATLPSAPHPTKR